MSTEPPRGISRRVRVDLDAFAANIRAARAARPDSAFDARADAYGHGIRLLGPVARDLGVLRIRVSNPADARMAESAGFTPAQTVVGQIDDEDSLIGREAYGVDPVDGARAVLTLSGEVVAVKHVGADAGVSYGYSYRTRSATTLALVGLGYADGVPRSASGRAQVTIAGRVLPVAGRIAMDQFVVDCGDTPPEPGDEVVLFGEPRAGHRSASDWATAGWTALAVTSGLGRRLAFRTGSDS